MAPNMHQKHQMGAGVRESVMNEKDTQEIVDTYLRQNPEIATVLEIANRANLAESANAVVSTLGPADIQPVSTPEYQGSRVTPLVTQRVWF